MYVESLKVVVPMGIMMLVGYLCKLSKLSNSEGERMLNDLVYRVFMPCMLFYSIATCPSLKSMDARVFLLIVTSIAISVIVVAVLLRRMNREMRVSMLIGMCRTNMSVYGSAVSMAMLSATDAKLAMFYLSFGVAVQNVLLLGALEIAASARMNPLRILLKVIKNPQIAAAICATALNLMGVELPEVLRSPLSSFAQCATPLAFMMLGVGFRFSKERSENLGIAAVVLCRLILIPAAILLPVAAVMGMNQLETVIMCCALATPCAVSSLPLSNQFGGNSTVTNESIVYSSILSIVTFPLFVHLCNLICAM